MQNGGQRAKVVKKKLVRRLLQCFGPEMVMNRLYSVGSTFGEKWTNLRHILEIELIRFVDSLDVKLIIERIHS